ncbi:hypothetical protein PSHT_05806 [Puccinia striiformis]|uniref:Adenylate kinase active site lid domain-containing protein n=4 Tax=Puccinia striiformis TaxID=27350 RepID=A0A0L0VHW2_9BASI|nr:hypothetical protein PSTG_07870 [Puccinia striiformis f. sp. tritici PST-78]POW18476.1 hypothetical protein PSHT_05806 [Puccinia striiformis]
MAPRNSLPLPLVPRLNGVSDVLPPFQPRQRPLSLRIGGTQEERREAKNKKQPNMVINRLYSRFTKPSGPISFISESGKANKISSATKRSFYYESIEYHQSKFVQSPLPSNSDPDSKIRMIILGAPGSGKGTHCKKLMETYDIDLIGTGDLLRWNVDNKTDLGKLAEEYICKGALLPDDIMIELVKPELKKLKHRSWILDGLPRTRSQAIKLDEFLSSELDDQLNMVVSLEVPDEVIIKRITGRWIHGPSGRVYNTTYNPPLVEGKDDYTGEKLTKRKDDTIEVFANRLRSFHLENQPLLDFYDPQFFISGHHQLRKLKKLVHFFGDTSDQIWPDLHKTIQQRFPDIVPRTKPPTTTSNQS